MKDNGATLIDFRWKNCSVLRWWAETASDCSLARNPKERHWSSNWSVVRSS